jgi:hypothetical protein
MQQQETAAKHFLQFWAPIWHNVAIHPLAAAATAVTAATAATAATAVLHAVSLSLFRWFRQKTQSTRRPGLELVE